MKDASLLGVSKAILFEGHFVFLNEKERCLQVYSDTAFVGTIGRYGQGPGEFEIPRTMAADHRGIHVLDANSGMVTVFNLKGKVQSSYELKQEPRETFYTSDMCFWQGRLVIAHSKGDFLARVFDLEGRWIKDIKRGRDPYPLTVSFAEELVAWDGELFAFSRFNGDLRKLDLGAGRSKSFGRLKLTKLEAYLEYVEKQASPKQQALGLEILCNYFPPIVGKDLRVISVIKTDQQNQHQGGVFAANSWLRRPADFSEIKDGVLYLKALKDQTVVVTKEGDLYLKRGVL